MADLVEALVQGSAALFSILGLRSSVLGNLIGQIRDRNTPLSRYTRDSHQVRPELAKPSDQGVEGGVGVVGPHLLHCSHPPHRYLEVFSSIFQPSRPQLITSDLEVRSKRSSATAGVNLSLPKTVRNSSYKATILDLSMMCVNLSPFLILNSFKYLPFSDTVILEAQCCKPNGGKGDTVPGLSAAQGPGAHGCQGNS